MSKSTHDANIIPVSTSLYENFKPKATAEKSPVSGRVFLLSLQAILNALIIGVVAKGLVMLIELITNFSFYGRFSFQPASPANNHLGWMVLFVPIAGSILVGLMARFGSSAIRGHGIPEAMEKIITEDSKIPVKLTFLKPISAAISIGTGGPFGAEGPIIATGGAFGSFAGQIMRISSSERKIMLAAGACAGMSAIFGSPLAAVLLAIELLLFEFSPRSVIPVALSCAAGAAMHLVFFGSQPVFQMADIPAATGTALTTYILMGAIIGVIASFVSKSVYLLEDAFERLPIHWMWWPAIGAVAVGCIGYFAPGTMGVGYENISNLLGGTLPVGILLTLCLLKYLSWVVALGSGTSGGTLAPLFTIGGATGALLGICALSLFPGSGINIATAALIGMAAMFAGASRALLTSIVFSLETTAQPHGLLPLLGACTAAYFVSFFLMKGSIMTEKILRRGVRTPDAYEPDVLQRIGVEQAMDDAPLIVSADNNTGELISWCLDNPELYKQQHFIVADEQENFIGYIKKEQLFRTDKAHSLESLIVHDLPVLHRNNDLGLASELMGHADMDVMAVVSTIAPYKIEGVVTASDILQHYSIHRKKEEKYLVSISIRRRTRRLIVKGRLLMQPRKAQEEIG
ncbi:MAG TPA: chloride channel protein [Panacibacter sp.]|nr:chloride channel protein [Panacibacter sp.]HNP45243.1 chloride channel protein [Panacibacter sp.]